MKYVTGDKVVHRCKNMRKFLKKNGIQEQNEYKGESK